MSAKSESKKLIKSNEEILFIYDAEMTNPNGDPDNENKPRMDIATSTNIVTDVRLKRYIRDYLEKYEKREIYVTNPEGIVLNASDRLKFMLWRDANPKKEVNLKEAKKKKLNDLTYKDVQRRFIDIRLFGATIPIKAEGGGSSIQVIGPLQFTWGTSFNQVEFVDTTGITSHFSSGEGSQGTMGTDYRIYYSLLGFYGILSAKRAQHTTLTEEDIKLFDKSIVKCIPLMATRSKIGQFPRLYLRIIYKTEFDFIGDLRRYIKIKNPKGLRKIDDVKFDFSKLDEVIDENKNKIEKIVYWADKSVKFDKCNFKQASLFEDLKIE
ncbi:type I-B CRISPR-associated protein Cas7/Csh2 [Candidatus Harpocratesius sp.]